MVRRRYGPPDVIELDDVAAPVARGDRVLIRVHAASINRSDWESLTARPVYVRLSGGGFMRPKQPILGSDVAGTVEAVGGEVTGFEVGDQVFGDALYHGGACFAEYVAMRQGAPLVAKPAGLSFEEAATLPQAGALALQGLRHLRATQPGDRVLVIGGGGGGGSFAIQIAKSYGAEVTGVDSTGKLDAMRSWGADHVVDYTRENFAEGGRRFDRILDFATHRSLSAYARTLDGGGVYSMVGGSMPKVLKTVALGRPLSVLARRAMGLLIAKPNKEDLTELASLVTTGVVSPAIDRRCGLDGVPAALQALGEGRVVGKAVVVV